MQICVLFAKYVVVSKDFNKARTTARDDSQKVTNIIIWVEDRLCSKWYKDNDPLKTSDPL